MRPGHAGRIATTLAYVECLEALERHGEARRVLHAEYVALPLADAPEMPSRPILRGAERLARAAIELEHDPTRIAVWEACLADPLGNRPPASEDRPP